MDTRYKSSFTDISHWVNSPPFSLPSPSLPPFLPPFPQLLAWIQQTLPWLDDRTPENTLTDAQSRREEFRQYASATKPPKADEKGKLETHFHTLQTKLRLSNRPAYVPSEGKLVAVSVCVIEGSYRLVRS